MAENPIKALVSIDVFLKFAENLDYLIVGGGTAGLALAARLSEDSQIKVGVLEVGDARLNDPNILTPLLFPTLVGNPDYDWDYRTTKQDTLNGTSFRVPRGKVLGGSSAINWMVYARGQKEEYDDWELMGNKGWNWESLQPYFLKSQNLQNGNKRPEFPFDEKHHHVGGPISTSYPPYLFPIEEMYHQAAANSGLDWDRNKDPQGGSTMGGTRMLSTVHRSQNIHFRSYSVNGYFLPVVHRENLAVLTKTLATKILLQKGQGHITVSGAEFEHKGSTYTIKVKREVLLCGGTYESPKLLELSGIGHPEVLKRCGVDLVLENPKVGENMQDHYISGCCYELIDGELSLDLLKDPKFLAEAMKEYEEKGTGILTAHNNLMGSVAFASIATEEEKLALKQIIMTSPLKTPAASAEMQRQILARCMASKDSSNLVFNLIVGRFDTTKLNDLPACFAATGAPGKTYITISDSLRQAFSRGSVHIKSKDPHEQVLLDPAYLSHPADLKILSAGLVALDKIAKTEPLASKIARRQFPPEGLDMGSATTREEYVMKHVSHEFHPVGSCSMGEVVDERLRVIGVKGLRVVDASVIPLHISANTQSAVYAIAEKAADMIKEDYIKA